MGAAVETNSGCTISAENCTANSPYINTLHPTDHSFSHLSVYDATLYVPRYFPELLMNKIFYFLHYSDLLMHFLPANIQNPLLFTHKIRSYLLGLSSPWFCFGAIVWAENFQIKKKKIHPRKTHADQGCFGIVTCVGFFSSATEDQSHGEHISIAHTSFQWNHL